MGIQIFIAHDDAKFHESIGDCMDCQTHPDYQPTCEACAGTGKCVDTWQVNSYSFNGWGMPKWLNDATQYYNQLTYSQCHSLASQIQDRMSNGETHLVDAIGEPKPVDKLPSYLRMFNSLANEARALDCLVYIG